MLLYLIALLVATSQARNINKIAGTDVTTILNTLANKDVNGGGQDEVVVNFQNMASHKIFDHDNAPNPLFTSVSSRIRSGSTIKAYETLQALYTISDITTEDLNSPARVTAANAFLDAVIATDLMKTAQDFLATAGLSSSDAATFKQQLFGLWFTPYARSGTTIGSSGFEGVFVGETASGDVLGLNYWYIFFLLEQAGKVNYHGWFTREKGVQMELQFSWNDDHDMMDSFLLGTSPEFDLAAYTICALANVGDCQYSKSGNPVDLTVKTTKAADGTVVIESVYPSMNGGSPVTESPGVSTTKGSYPASALQDAIDKMWDADDNKPTLYKLDWGNPRSGTKDTSPNPLITSYDEAIFEKPQYKALNAMYDAEIFHPDVCIAEDPMSGFRKQYINAVFDAFTNTTTFQIAFEYLKSVGKATDWETFRPKLWTLWMGTYSRCSGTLGSSGFEHVFSGEWKGSKVDGQHCWVKYYRHEKAGEINYHGYISYDEQLTGTFQYTWETYLKNIGGFNLGTSPGFDFSVFSICALTKTGSNACKFNLMGYPIAVTSYTQQCNDGICLSTAYPSD